MRSKVFHFTTLYAIFEYAFGSAAPNNPFPAIQHLFNDTRHRRVNYKTIATSRYREYFFSLVNDRKEKGLPFPLTRESNLVKNVIIPSSARPLAPQVEYVIPTFEWNRETKGLLTATARISGLRVYLKRPWYSSGEGEQLAVVWASKMYEKISNYVPVTTWGTDPTKLSSPLPGGIKLDATNFVNIKDGNTELALATSESPTTTASIVAYDVKYDTERQLYYADILLNIALAYYPFIRLALARYQRNSIRKDGTDCCLSPIVEADYIQIPAPRGSSIKAGMLKNVITVAISGTVPAVPTPPEFRTRIDFIIEPIEVPSSESTHISINAKPIDTYSYILTEADIKNFTFLHNHEFKLPVEYGYKPYRVKVLEYEMITYDNLKPNPNPGGAHFGGMPMKERLVYADVYEVNA